MTPSTPASASMSAGDAPVAMLAATGPSTKTLLPVPTSRLIVLAAGVGDEDVLAGPGHPARRRLTGGDDRRERAVAEQRVLIRVRQRDERRAVAVGGEAERRQRACRRGNGRGRRAGHPASIERHDVDRARIGIGLQRDQEPLLVNHADLRRAAGRRNSAARQRQSGRAVQPVDGTPVNHERVDRRGAGDVHMVVAEVHADRRAGRRDDACRTSARPRRA